MDPIFNSRDPIRVPRIRLKTCKPESVKKSVNCEYIAWKANVTMFVFLMKLHYI